MSLPANSPKGLVAWWYNIAAPREPEQATFEDRERIRAGRLSSIILLISFCFGISQLPNAIVTTNHIFSAIVLVAMAINVLAFFLNKRGKVLEAGTIMVFVVEIGFILVVLTSRYGVTARSLTIFHLIIVTQLMAVSLLPPKTVFLTTFCNAFFTWLAITFLRAPDFRFTTPTSYYNALTSPIVLQIIVAIITYLWAQGAREALARAEKVAALERALAEKDRIAAHQKQQLEQDIQHILHIHVQAANGNFGARAPIAQDNTLWQVAHGLNTLLARLQRATHSETELQKAEKEVDRFLGAVRRAKVQRQQLQLPKNGTILDPLAQELSGTHINQP